MVIEKPIGTNLAEAQELNRRGAEGAGRVAGVPDRPLPGQGDRPEHAGVPVRQRHVRADLEPQLHRLRPDHGGRGHRHRHPRRLLRHLRRAARPGPEPHAPAADAAVHGAAGHLLGRRRARREGQGPARDPPARARATCRTWPCGPSTRPAWPRASRCPATSRRRACPTDSTTETYAALRLEVDNWRWAGVPIYLRTGKRLARKVTEIAVTLKPVPHLAFEQAGSVGVQPNQIVLTMQPNEGVSLSLGAKIPGTRMRIRPGEHGVPLRDGVHVGVARGLRAADHGRHARRRHAVHARRRGRGAVADHATRSSRPGPRSPGPLPQYPAGSGGPAEADALILDGRPHVARDLMGDADALAGGRLERTGHHARGDRGRAAGAAQGAARQERGLRPGAGAQPGGGRRPRVARARSRTGSTAWAATTPRARSCARSSRAARPSTPGSRCRPTQDPRPGELALCPRAGGARRGAGAPEGARHDRRPARGQRPGDGPVVARTGTPRPWTRCCTSRRWCCVDSVNEPDPGGGGRPGAPARRGGLRGRPRLAALDSVARAGHRHASTRRQWREELGRISAVTVAPPARLGRRRAALLRLAGLAARLGARARSSQQNGELYGRAQGTAPGRRAACSSRTRRRTRRGWPGSPSRRPRACRISLDRGPGGLSAHRRDARRQRVALDGARRLARRGRASSARASARRCCATPPTRPALECAAAHGGREAAGPRDRDDPGRRWPPSAWPAPRRARGDHRRLDAARRLRARRPSSAPDWSGVTIWFTDERCVPPDHEHSNYRMAKEALLDRIDGRRGAADARASSARPRAPRHYERELREAFGDEHARVRPRSCSASAPTSTPARCSPATTPLGERERRVVGVETPGMAPLVSRITLTLPVVNAARSVVFLVTGEDKAEAVGARVRRPARTRRAPAAWSRPRWIGGARPRAAVC